jgi:hypothetical protein
VAVDSAAAVDFEEAAGGDSRNEIMRISTIIPLFVAGALLAANPIQAAHLQGEGFESPYAAAKGLLSAAESDDVAALVKILGPSAKAFLITSDPVADKQLRRKFVEAARQRIKVAADAHNPKARTVLVGTDAWPLPIPIVQANGKWYFDPERGKQEILARRIGSNELDAIEVCRGYVEAQNEYAERDRTGSGTQHYAQTIISAPAKQDGLYWAATDQSDESPMADLIAQAFAEGYTNRHQPYRGYYFKILTAQGPHATGGAMSYLQNGLMTRGFALVAWPSDFGSTGMMTFIVDKSGIVYEKNLGPKTSEIARDYDAYDPDETWAPVATSARK